MDYHSDRFEDYSLMIYFKKKLIALLPANRVGHILYSHKGLSYGGLLLLKNIKLTNVIDIFGSLLEYLESNKLNNLYLKQVPSIYSLLFTEEVDYLMFLLEAELVQRDTLSVIDLSKKIKVSASRLEGYKRGLKHGLVVKEEESFELFWNNILIKNLRNKHNVSPVHSLQEIELLKGRFKTNIRQFNVYHKEEIVAGTTIFESNQVAHSQYISGDENKNKLGSLDFLHLYLIEKVFNKKKYFDFGSSNEYNGMKINRGLLFWKEGFGARTVTQDFYKIDVKNYRLLTQVLI